MPNAFSSSFNSIFPFSLLNKEGSIYQNHMNMLSNALGYPTVALQPDPTSLDHFFFVWFLSLCIIMPRNYHQRYIFINFLNRAQRGKRFMNAAQIQKGWCCLWMIEEDRVWKMGAKITSQLNQWIDLCLRYEQLCDLRRLDG